MDKKVCVEQIVCLLENDVIEVSDNVVEQECMKKDNELLLKIANHNLVDGIYITFEWGEEECDLTNDEYGKDITCDVGYGIDLYDSLNDNSKEKDNGRYFIIYPNTNKQYMPYMYIKFGNIMTLCEGITHMKIKYLFKNLENQVMDETQWTYLPIIKKNVELKINKFESYVGTVHKGERTTLTWEALGADYCILHPNGIKLSSIGEYEIEVNDKKTYTLSAICGDRICSKQTTVYVYEDISIQYFKAEPSTYYLGSKVKLSWNLLEDCECKLAYKNETKTVSNKGSIDSIRGEENYILSVSNSEKKYILRLEPDSDKVILDYNVTASKDIQNNSYIYKIDWNTYNAKKVYVFCRWRKKGEKKYLSSYSKEPISEDIEKGSKEFAYIIEKDNKDIDIIFLLRVINKDGKMYEAIKVFKNDIFVSEINNL